MGSGPNVLQPIIHIYFCIKSELALLTVNKKIKCPEKRGRRLSPPRGIMEQAMLVAVI